jgi:type IV secretion system protein VirD4
VDFGAQLARTTAAFRERELGHRNVFLDPFRQFTKSPDTFNPLDFIDRNSDTAIDDCRALAESQVVRSGQEREPHFPDSAETWIGGSIGAVVRYGDSDDRSLQTARELVTDPRKIDVMKQLLCESDAWGGMLSRLGFQLTHFKDRELASTLTTTNRYLRYLDTPAVAESTGKSSFNPSELPRGKMTIYLILPLEHARTQSPLLRMWISAMLSAVVRGGLQEHNKVHFVLDEAASLGHLCQLDDALERYRAYGVRLMFFYQSLGQLKKCFPEGQDQTLLSNVTQVFFSVNELHTAEYVSGRLGEETIVVNSGGMSRGDSFQRSDNGQGSYTQSRNWSDNWQQHSRKLLKPEEVMSLSDRTAITFAQGVPPICTTLRRYYEDEPKWAGWQSAICTLGLSLCVFIFCGVIALAIATAPPVQPRHHSRPAVLTSHHPVKKR